MADQLCRDDSNSLTTSLLPAKPENPAGCEQKSSVKTPNLKAGLTPDCCQAQWEQSTIDARVEVTSSNMSDYGDKLYPTFAQSSISRGSRADTVRQEAELSNELQAASDAIKSANSNLSKANFCGAVQTESIKPLIQEQSEPVFCQAPCNELKQESNITTTNQEGENVLDIVRAKLAERAVVLFDRKSNKSSVEDWLGGEANCCEVVVSKEDQLDGLVSYSRSASTPCTIRIRAQTI